MDVASIAVGTRWAEVIEQTLRSCHVAVILVGKHWLDIQPDGTRRLDRDDDPTRAEISIALRLKLKIVPLLVAGAAMPDRGHLPAEIASVTEWQALRVDDDDFEHDATRLIRALETQLDESATLAEPVASGHSTAPSVSAHPTAGSGFNFKSRSLWIAVATVVVALVVVQVVGLWPNRPSTPDAGTSRSISADAGTTPKSSSMSPSGNDAGGTNRPAESNPQKGNTGSSGSGSPQNAQPAQSATPLAGRYSLVSYSFEGTRLPLVGTLKVSPVERLPLDQPRDPSAQHYTFESAYRTQEGVEYRYQGSLQGSGSSWWIVTTQSNDPDAKADLFKRITTQISYDGSTLTIHTGRGQRSVWRRQ